MNKSKEKDNGKYGIINSIFELPVVKVLIAPVIVAVITAVILSVLHLSSNPEALPPQSSLSYSDDAFITIGGIRIMDEHIFYIGILLIITSALFGIMSIILIRNQNRRLEETLTKEYGPEYIIPNDSVSPIKKKE